MRGAGGRLDRRGCGLARGSRRVYWVDINRFLIHRFDPQTGNVRTLVLRRAGDRARPHRPADTLVVALGSKVILWQPANDARADFANPERNWPRVRLNDGRPDPAGNFWVGTMQNNVAADGSDIPITDDAVGRLFRVARRRRRARSRRPASASPTPSAGARTRRASISATRSPTRSTSGTTTSRPARSPTSGRSSPASIAAARTARRSTATATSGTPATAAAASSASRRTARSTASSRCRSPPSPPAPSAARLKTLYITTAGGGVGAGQGRALRRRPLCARRRCAGPAGEQVPPAAADTRLPSCRTLFSRHSV